MTHIQRSIIAATLMHTILQEYEVGEMNSTGQKVARKVRKYMQRRARISRKEFMEMLQLTDRAWRETINHFAKEKLKIEAKTTIACIYNNLQEECEKQIGIKEKLFEKFMIDMFDDPEAEHNSDKVVEYLLDVIGIKAKQSAFSGKRLTIANNLIVEGKDVDERFLWVVRC